ncbi:MAG: tail fiber domain-containing protein [Flavobacteriales bacterium]|nr:tail fiber domain-containing protein [Flavobacteriales bacterium]
MRTKKFLKHLFLGALLLSTGKMVGQVTTASNVAAGPNDFLGWNNNAVNNFPLRIRHDRNQPIQWFTNSIQRMRLMQTVTGVTINTYTNQDLSGNLGIGAFTSGNVPRPFSLLHLDNGGTQFSGYRPWFRPGMTITNGSDLAWIGLKNEGYDINHLTLAWADNTLQDGPDLFKVVFLAKPGTTGTAGTLNGLETMRIQPAIGGTESFLGIGDWFTAGANPTERLDLLNGRARIRQLPDDPEVQAKYKIMVVDDSPVGSAERGVVKWLDPASLPGGTGCEWTLQNSGVPGPSVPHNVYTAVGSSDICPDDLDAVGVGTSSPKAKLHVFTTTPGYFGNDVILGHYKSDQSGGRAVNGAASSALSTTFSNNTLTGVQGSAENGKYSTGVAGRAINWDTSPGITQDVIGVSGMAKAYGNANRVIGVYGYGGGASNGSNDWAAYFDGRGYLTSGPWQPSDMDLKVGVEELDPGQMAAALLELQPKTYGYNVEGYPSMNLPAGVQRGLISQEVEAVFPDLVTDVIHPAQVDSAGNVIEPELHFKAMNYQGFIPVLIAGFQHQQQVLEQQRAMIADLQAKVANCCAADQGMAPQDVPTQKDAPQTGDLQEQRLLVIPNPVADLTTLEYYVPHAGKVSLSVSTSDGKPLGTLREEQAEPGVYSYQWNTTRLAAGTYICTFLLDGAVVVKRAVKVK